MLLRLLVKSSLLLIMKKKPRNLVLKEGIGKGNAEKNVCSVFFYKLFFLTQNLLVFLSHELSRMSTSALEGAGLCFEVRFGS